MIKADPSDIKDDSSCDKALRHLKQLVQDMTCMEVESVWILTAIPAGTSSLLPCVDFCIAEGEQSPPPGIKSDSNYGAAAGQGREYWRSLYRNLSIKLRKTTGYPVPSLHTERDCFSPRRAAAAAGTAEKVKQSSQVSGSNSTSGSA